MIYEISLDKKSTNVRKCNLLFDESNYINYGHNVFEYISIYIYYMYNYIFVERQEL